jgi:hypothetical protein
MLSDLVPDEETGRWLLALWDDRGTVSADDRCVTPLIYEDGSTGRCVLSRSHHDPDATPVDVPHADENGRLAPLLVRRQTILEVRRVHDRERDSSDTAREAEVLAEAARIMRKYRGGLSTTIAVLEETQRMIESK